VDSYIKHPNMDNYPTELVLALNKAKTISWRLGVAWTLMSGDGEVLTCNGKLFNQHIQLLIADLQMFSTAKKLYISYCPVLEDLNSQFLLDSLRVSNLVEVHVCMCETDKIAIKTLAERTAIPTLLWPRDQTQTAHSIGIAWVRSTLKPWVHVVCSNSLGGGSFPIAKLGIMPYVMLKGIESSLLYVQTDSNHSFGTQLVLADPEFIESSNTLIRSLRNLSATAASVVTVVCDPSWLSLIVRMGLATEVSYFLSLRSMVTDVSITPPIVEFPETDQWMINSSEVMGDFMQIVLQKG